MARHEAHSLVVWLILSAGSISSAQLTDNPGLTLDGAKQVIAAAVTEARKVKAPQPAPLQRR
jgi:hypothetical protein